MAFAADAQSVEQRLISVPKPNEALTIAPGEELFSFLRAYSTDGAALDVKVKAGNWMLEQWYEAGTELVPVTTSSKFKACVSTPGTLDASGTCFLDDDGDGTFDRHAGDSTTMARRLKPPIRYTKRSVTAFREDSFKYVIIFTGGTQQDLRFSYREFKDNLARPAFTEDLVVPRGSFPQMIRLKDHQFQIEGIDGMGFALQINTIELTRG